MRVQVIIPDSFDRPMGGLGEQCRQVLRSSARLRPDVFFDVVSVSEEPTADGVNFHVRPVSPVVLPLGRPMPGLDSLFQQAPLAAAAVASPSPPAVVHAYDWSAYLAGIESARHWRVPLVVTQQLSNWAMSQDIYGDMRDAPYAVNLMADISLGIDIMAMQAASAVIHVSDDYRRRYGPLGEGKATVIPNGIDIAEWDADAGRTLPLPGKNRQKMVYIGRYDGMKNVEALLAADVPADLDVCFIGSYRGGHPRVFQAMIDACRERPNFHYLGPQYGPDKRALLRAADFQIVPSVHEPFGIVALEALASRSVLLTSFAGGMSEFLDETCAIDCGTTPQSIAAAIRRAMNLHADQRLSLTDAGVEVARRYTWDAAASAICGVYDRVAAPRYAAIG